MSRFKPTTIRHSIFTRCAIPIAGFMAVLMLPSLSQADTFRVNNAGDDAQASCPDSCTLRAAILAANANSGKDTIYINTDINPNIFLAGADENSAVTGDLDIIGDVDIIGEKPDGRNIISANRYDRVFHTLNAANVSFQNISIRDGVALNEGGGGVHVDGASTVEFVQVEIKNNEVSINSSGSQQTSFLMTGGGLYIGLNAIAVITDSEITDNTAPAGGALVNAGRADINNTLISGNTASGQSSNGGGIANQGGFLNIGNSTISNNTSTDSGGGIFTTNQGVNIGNVIITNTAITNNLSARNGAGISNLAPLSLNNSTVSGNQITFQGNGAGIYNSAIASLDAVNSTISSNGGPGTRSGGGIFTTRDVSLTNVTLYNNKASPLANSTSVNNTIGGNQLTVFTSSAANEPNVVLVNTIVADGPNSDIDESPCAGSAGYTDNIASSGNNMENENSCGLVTTGSFLDLVNIADVGLDNTLQVDQNPDLANTTPVHALLAGSPAIDNGSDAACPTVDQRFLLRDSCDIGAYEFNATVQQGNSVVDLKATISDSPDPVAPNNTAQTLSYSIAVTNLYVDSSADDVIVSIRLPETYQFNNISTTSTGILPNCEAPDFENVITCTVSSIAALGQVDFFVAGHPTQVGTITARVDVFSSTQDAFEQNNLNITEDTVVSLDADDTSNFGSTITNGGGGGGGGAMHSLVLLLTTLVLLRRRLRR